MDLTSKQFSHAHEFVRYTFVDMARLCATYGWDKNRSRSVERLRIDLTPEPLGYRRAMVVGRQLFFFSHAYRLTEDPLYEDRSRLLFNDLVKNFWDRDNGGWYFSLNDDDSPQDTTKDLYSHAFIMFGLAHYLAILEDKNALQWIYKTNDLILTRFRLPKGWFSPAATPDWTLLRKNLEQNPHMHLLESYLSLYNATQDGAFLKCGTQIISVYTEKLRTSDASKILEHLDENGQPSDKDGILIQPGHLYEWYWLVSEYADIANLPVYRASCAPIMDWADRCGLDLDTGGIYDMIDTAGNIVSNRKRIWPVTECIKAATTRVRATPSVQSRESLLYWITFMMEKYRGNDGAWHEYLNRNLEPDCDYMPMSTPYHVAMAALEVERLFGGPGAFGMKKMRSPDFGS